jgi:hypothetical protein
MTFALQFQVVPSFIDEFIQPKCQWIIFRLSANGSDSLHIELNYFYKY